MHIKKNRVIKPKHKHSLFELIDRGPYFIFFFRFILLSVCVSVSHHFTNKTSGFFFNAVSCFKMIFYFYFHSINRIEFRQAMIIGRHVIMKNSLETSTTKTTKTTITTAKNRVPNNHKILPRLLKKAMHTVII